MQLKSIIYHPIFLIVILIFVVYWQFFIQGKIPVPADTLVGAYFPWLDYKWGYEVGVPVKNPPISDVFSQFFIWKYLAVDIIKNGEIPLWNPYSFSGTPFLATYHSATFFPLNIILFLPRYFSWGLYIFFQTLMAALGMYLLVGQLVKNSLSKVAAGVVFSLSGLMATWAEFGTGVWAAAMLPWALYFLKLYWKTNLLRFLLLFCLSLSFLYLAGHAQLSLYSVSLFLIYLIYHLVFKKMKVRGVLLPLFFTATSIILVMFQMLPSYELVSQSVREGEAYSKTFNYGLNPLYELIRFFAADFFGNPTTYNHWDKISYHEQSSFLGTLTIPLIAPLLFKRFRKGESGFWLGILLVSIFLAFESPLTSFFYSLPLPFLTYSSASRIFFILSLSAAILVGYALQRYIEDQKYKLFVLKISLVAVVGLIFALLVVAYTQGVNSVNFKVSFKNSLLPTALLSFLVLISYIKSIKQISVWLIVFFIFLDLARYFQKYNPFVKEDLIFPKTQVIKFLQKQPPPFRISRIDQEVLPPNTWTMYGIESIEGYDPLALRDYARYFNRLNGNLYKDQIGRYVEAKRFPTKFLDALNAKYILAIKKEDQEDTKRKDFKKIYQEGKTIVYENPNFKERIYYIPKITTAKTEDSLTSMIDNVGFDPTKEAVVFTSEQFNEIGKNGKASILSQTHNSMMIETETENSAFLIIANSFDRGWKLYQNEKISKLYEVNGAIQGIMVPEGKHLFKLEYWPDSFAKGVKISLLGFILLFAVNIYSIIKKIW